MRRSRGLGTLSPYISPYAPEPLQEEVLSLTLSWGRRTLEHVKGVRGIVKVYLGLQG